MPRIDTMNASSTTNTNSVSRKQKSNKVNKRAAASTVTRMPNDVTKMPSSMESLSSQQQTKPEENLVIPFISCCQDGSYVVSDEAVEFLSTLDGPFGVLSMVGPYRTGKSTLLNRCILQEQIFKGGSTINACTKGILLVKKVLDGPYNKTTETHMPVIVMDTEGLGSIDATNTHDVRIFSMALLLSSLFIYNSVGSIDENAISTLSLVTTCCEMLKLDNNDSSSSNAASLNQIENAQALGKHAFPPLLWLVRDFALQLLNPNGDSITPKQYLEQALQSITSSSSIGANAELVRDKNNVRATIKSCFPLRQCITMVRPVEDEQQLQQLSNDMSVQVRRAFEDQLNNVREIVFSNIEAKTIAGTTAVTGRGLVMYAKSIVAAINNGQQPVIRDVWTQITETQCRDALSSAKLFFTQKLVRHMNGSMLFVSELKKCNSESQEYNSSESQEYNSSESQELHSDSETIIKNISKKTIELFKSRPMPTGQMQQKYLSELKIFMKHEVSRWDQQRAALQISNIETQLNASAFTIDNILSNWLLLTENTAIGNNNDNSEHLQTLFDALKKTRAYISEFINTITNDSSDLSDKKYVSSESADFLSESCTDSDLQHDELQQNNNIIATENIKLTLLKNVCSRHMDRQLIWAQTLASTVNSLILCAMNQSSKLREVEQQLQDLELLQSSSVALANSENAISNYNDMRAKLAEEIDIITKRAVDAEATVTSLEESIRDQQIDSDSRCHNAEQEKEELQQRMMVLNDEISKYKSLLAKHDETDVIQLKKAQEQYADQLRQFKLSVDELRRQHVTELEQYKEQSEKRIDDAERRATQYDAARKQVLQIVSDLRSENKQQQDQRLVEQIDWSHRIAEAESIRANMSNLKRKCDDEHRPALKRLKTLQTDHASLQTELKFVLHENQRFDKQLTEKTLCLEKLQDLHNHEKLKHQEELLRSVLSNSSSISSSIGNSSSNNSSALQSKLLWKK